MSTTALSTAGRFPVRRKRPNRPALDNASRLVASVVRGPVHFNSSKAFSASPRSRYSWAMASVS
jgi:hypothetical protein